MQQLLGPSNSTSATASTFGRGGVLHCLSCNWLGVPCAKPAVVSACMNIRLTVLSPYLSTSMTQPSSVQLSAPPPGTGCCSLHLTGSILQQHCCRHCHCWLPAVVLLPGHWPRCCWLVGWVQGAAERLLPGLLLALTAGVQGSANRLHPKLHRLHCGYLRLMEYFRSNRRDASLVSAGEALHAALWLGAG